MTDLAALPNPYDFANPVSDIELFIGRKEELEEIKYYLDQASRSRRPINIAILGGRASGKTSLLNITEQEAKKIKLLTVRIDLDESDAANQWTFLFKIFDALFSAACDAGAFGGKQGKTFETYIDTTCSLVVPSEKIFCPFLFPIQYAKAAAGNNLQGHVPDYSFRQDLVAIQSEVAHPIILLFDEGNVLSKSRVHLQKLRNVFMNTPGYMLIVTGTPEMFPLMDEVFSPIIRQFKKVNLAQFTDVEDTEGLMRKYLEAASLKPDKFFDFEDSNDLEDIHNLTGGRPYEIQLVCHTLFRRIQQKRAANMKLDLGAIEDVRQQLESSQNLAGRPVLQKIRALSLSRLKALTIFSACAGAATLEQVWAIERVFGFDKWTREDVEKKLSEFKADGILEENETGIICFKGDDFDRIYTKYLSLEKNVPVQFSEFSVSLYVRLKLASYIGSLEKVTELAPFHRSRRYIDIKAVVEGMGTPGGLTDVFVETPTAIVKSVYNLLFESQSLGALAILEVRLSLAGIDVQTWITSRERLNSKPLEDCRDALEGLRARITDVGGKLFVQLLEIPVPAVDATIREISASGNQRLREVIAESHAAEMSKGYTSGRIGETIARHAEAAYLLGNDLDASSLNNLGYFYLAAGSLERARELFLKSIAKQEEDDGSQGLPAFSLAMIEAKMGNIGVALARLGTIEKPFGQEIYCVHVARKTDTGIELTEIKAPINLVEEVSKATALLSECQLTDPTREESAGACGPAVHGAESGN